MSDRNPFDDLAGSDDESDGDGDAGTDADRESASAERPDAESGRPPTDRSDTGRSGASRSGAGHGDESSGESDPVGGGSVGGPSLSTSSPPFPYSDAEQKQMYVRDGLWEEFEDLGFDAELALRRDFDVRNVEQRELDTAVVRFVLEQVSAEEIAETVVRMRGFDPAESG